MSTSGKSKNSRKRSKGIDRPFAAEILKRARDIASRYQVILQQEDDLWLGRGLELPLAFEDGATPDECVRKTRDAFTSVIASMLEDGEKPPAPARESLRDQQVNIRLTAEEKVRLEESANQTGFRSLSDFMRSKALA